MMIGWKTAFLLTVAGLVAACTEPAKGEIGVADYQVENPFDGLGPADLSGIACIPIQQGTAYRCLTVNDETQTAQFATVEDGKIAAGVGSSLDRRIPRPGNCRHSA